MSSEFSGNFALLVREAREKRGLSQQILAEKAGLQATAISHFETGRRSPSFDNLKKLADALDVTTDFLLGRVSEMKSEGPKMQALFRNAQEISSVNQNGLDELNLFAEFLAQKNKQNKKED